MAIPLISAAHAGLARTLHMENRIAYGPSIDLQQDGPLPTTATWSALAQNSGEYVIALARRTGFWPEVDATRKAATSCLVSSGAWSDVHGSWRHKGEKPCQPWNHHRASAALPYAGCPAAVELEAATLLLAGLT